MLKTAARCEDEARRHQRQCRRRRVERSGAYLCATCAHMYLSQKNVRSASHTLQLLEAKPTLTRGSPLAAAHELPFLLLRRTSRLAVADPGAQGRHWSQQVHLQPPIHIEPQERLQHLRLQSGRRCRRRLCPIPVGSPSLRDAAARAAAGERRVGGDEGVESPACDGGARSSAGGEPDGLAHLQLPATPRPRAHSSHALRTHRRRARRPRARRHLAPLPL